MMIDAIAHVTVGVADLAPVRSLWIDRFGLEVVAARTGPDEGLATLWGISPEQTAEQLLLRTPGAATGYLHFVRFTDPGAPVRQGAAPTDLGPKSIDVNCHDMPARYAELQEAGYAFRSAAVEYEILGLQAREAQMPGHDDINVVLVEILSAGYEIEFTSQGYGAVTSFVVIVPDTRTEAAFYREVFGLDEIMHHRVTGPGIEEVVGLPPGAALDLRLMGREGQLFGRMELIAYEGLEGIDRFALAHAPAVGTLGCGYAVDSVQAFCRRARTAGFDAAEHPNIDTIFGDGDMGILYSPAGLRIELFSHRA